MGMWTASFNPDAYRFYAGLERRDFIYLDVKSLPRSGLHYMHDTFEYVLGPAFRSCEWYGEPGCCRQMPCALTCLATAAGPASAHRPVLRLVKSHDLDLSDPDFAPRGALRRILLAREPLSLLTSWWTLQILYDNAALLAAHHIMIDKISYRHEAEVLGMAYALIERHGTIPDAAALATWLAARQSFVRDFIAKWSASLRRDGGQIVHYADLPGVIASLLRDLRAVLPPGLQDRVDLHLNRTDQPFMPRADPFVAQVPRITAHLQAQAAVFRAAADAILADDPDGVLQGR